MKKVYYAHPVSLYGTSQEVRDITNLLHLGAEEVLNPNNQRLSASYAQRGMEAFRDEVLSCSALAFRAFPDGGIPAGVRQEIDWALQAGLPVFELPFGLLQRTRSVEETREYLRESGAR